MVHRSSPSSGQEIFGLLSRAIIEREVDPDHTDLGLRWQNIDMFVTNQKRTWTLVEFAAALLKHMQSSSPRPEHVHPK